MKKKKKNRKNLNIINKDEENIEIDEFIFSDEEKEEQHNEVTINNLKEDNIRISAT